MSARAARYLVPAGLLAAAWAGAVDISGSLTGSAGYVALRDGPFYPDAQATLPDYAACSTLTVNVEAGEGSRMWFEGRCTADAVDGSVSFEVLRAYAELRLGEAFRFGLGRRLVGFGCGLIWNPVNAIDVPRNPFDRGASRPGLDGAFASLDLGAAAGFPLSLSLQAVPPPFEDGVELSASTLAAQAYAYLGGVELGIVGSCTDPAGDLPRWSAGFWGTLDLAGLVLGVETAWRKSDLLVRPDADGLPLTDGAPRLFALLSASLWRGDFFLYAEGQYSAAGLSVAEAGRVSTAPTSVQPQYAFVATPGAIGAWHAAAGCEWAHDDLSLGLSAILDLEEAAAAICTTGSWAVDDASVLKLRAVVPTAGREVCEYDFLPFGWTATLFVEVYF